MNRIRISAIFAIALGVCAPSFAAGFKHENKAENLRALFSAIHQEIH